MALKLKDLFDREAVRFIAQGLEQSYPSFDKRAFERACLRGLEKLELTARARHIAEAMHAHLPRSFARSSKILIDSLGPELEHTDDFGLSPLRYMPHVAYVEMYGLDDFEASMAAQYELTKRFTAEWSIRAFLKKYPDATYARLQKWAADPNVHVRRLVSEGTRPRLPWAQRLPDFQKDPRPVIALLERLKDDPERYVQRSVANNLNDIAKDHPDIAVRVCKRWAKKASPGRRFIVTHALRSLVKKGDRAALEVLGFSDAPRVALRCVALTPRAARLGDKIRFSFELVSKAERSQQLLVDYVVHFVKKNGSTAPKVFKLKRVSLAPKDRVTLEAGVSFLSMTTRKHYPGRHRIELLLNGAVRPLAEFDVRR